MKQTYIETLRKELKNMKIRTIKKIQYFTFGILSIIASYISGVQAVQHDTGMMVWFGAFSIFFGIIGAVSIIQFVNYD